MTGRPVNTDSGVGEDVWAHQPIAVDAVERALRHGGRVTVESACGTGKTRVGAKAAARLAPAGRVLVMVPTRTKEADSRTPQPSRNGADLTNMPGPTIGLLSG